MNGLQNIFVTNLMSFLSALTATVKFIANLAVVLDNSYKLRRQRFPSITNNRNGCKI